MASPGIPRPKFNVGKIQVQGEFSGIWVDHASVKGQTADNLGLREIATAYEAGMEETFEDWHKGGRKGYEIQAVCYTAAWLEANDDFIQMATAKLKGV